MNAEGSNCLGDPAEPREEVEFSVGRGASVSVVGDETIKAVRASAADRDRQYKLAD